MNTQTPFFCIDGLIGNTKSNALTGPQGTRPQEHKHTKTSTYSSTATYKSVEKRLKVEAYYPLHPEGIHKTQSRKSQLYSRRNSASVQDQENKHSVSADRVKSAATVTTANRVHSTGVQQDRTHTLTQLRTKAGNEGITMYRQCVPYHMLEELF